MTGSPIIIYLYDFSFSKWKDDWNTTELAATGLIVFWAVVLNFLVCELGQWITSQYDMFGDELCACNWYALPMVMQRMYLMFLLNTQQPMYIQCYGGITCSREIFKKVITIDGYHIYCMKLFE